MKGYQLRPSTKEAWTNLSTSWVLGLDPSNTDKFRPRYAQAFTNLFVYLIVLSTAKFQDVPNNSKRSLTICYINKFPSIFYSCFSYCNFLFSSPYAVIGVTNYYKDSANANAIKLAPIAEPKPILCKDNKKYL